jgi:hypothetical protein
MPVHVVQKDVVTLVPTTHDVIHGTRIFQPELARHSRRNLAIRLIRQGKSWAFLRSDPIDTVTALYEIVPAGKDFQAAKVDALRYQQPGSIIAQSPEMLTIKLRYKLPDEETSKLIEMAVTDSGATFNGASKDLKFAAGVAAFGMILRDSAYKGSANYSMAEKLSSEGNDGSEYRQELVELIRTASKLAPVRTAMRTGE